MSSSSHLPLYSPNSHWEHPREAKGHIRVLCYQIYSNDPMMAQKGRAVQHNKDDPHPAWPRAASLYAGYLSAHPNLLLFQGVPVHKISNSHLSQMVKSLYFKVCKA